jgi:hypothetical protein
MPTLYLVLSACPSLPSHTRCGPLSSQPPTCLQFFCTRAFTYTHSRLKVCVTTLHCSGSVPLPSHSHSPSWFSWFSRGSDAQVRCMCVCGVCLWHVSVGEFFYELFLLSFRHPRRHQTPAIIVLFTLSKGCEDTWNVFPYIETLHAHLSSHSIPKGEQSCDRWDLVAPATSQLYK